MSVNVNYYGADWSTVVPVPITHANYNDYLALDIKRTNFTTQTASSGSEIYKGGWGVKATGAAFYQPFDYSIAWCAMDKNAPQTSKAWCNPNQFSGTNPVTIEFSHNPTSNSPVFMEAIPLYNGDRYCKWFGSSSTSTPTDELPWNIVEGKGSPTPTTSSGISAARIVSWCVNPIMSFPFRNFVLTPIIVAAKLKNGKTLADLDNYSSDTPESTIRNEMFDGLIRADLKSYIESTTANYINYPVVLQVMLLCQCVLYDANDEITVYVVGGRRDGYPCIAPRFFEKDNVSFEAHDPYTTQSETTQFNFNTSLCTPMVAPSTFTIWSYANNQATSASYSEIVATPILGSLVLENTYTASTAGNYNYYIGNYMCGDSKWHIRETGVSSAVGYNGRYHFVFTTVSDDGGEFTAATFKEYIRKTVAYYGMYFTDGGDITGLTPTSNNMMLGIIDSNGITHGNYSTGSDNANQIQADWNDPIEDTPYNPSGDDPWTDEDTNTYIDGMTGKESYSIAGFTRIYALNITQMRGLRQSLNSIPKFFDTSGRTINDYQLFLSHRFLNTNPIDNILSLKWYPILFTGPVEDIKISNCTMLYDLNEAEPTANPAINGYRITATQQTIHLGYFDLRSHHNSFLDYEPYTTVECYLPFTSGIQMDINVILNHKIYVSYKVDLKTGAFTAYLSLDSYNGNIITTAHGNIAVDLPVSGIQTANYQNAVYQGLTNLKAAQINIGMSAAQAAVGIGAALATGGAGAAALLPAVGNLANSQNQLQQARYNIDAQQVPYKTTGSNTSGDGILMYLYPALIMSKPQYMEGYNPLTYGHTTGFACVINTELSQVTGYTVCSNADLSGITATDAEIQKINQMLQSGIYL